MDLVVPPRSDRASRSRAISTTGRRPGPLSYKRKIPTEALKGPTDPT